MIAQITQIRPTELQWAHVHVSAQLVALHDFSRAWGVTQQQTAYICRAPLSTVEKWTIPAARQKPAFEHLWRLSATHRAWTAVSRSSRMYSALLTDAHWKALPADPLFLPLTEFLSTWQISQKELAAICDAPLGTVKKWTLHGTPRRMGFEHSWRLTAVHSRWLAISGCPVPFSWQPSQILLLPPKH